MKLKNTWIVSIGLIAITIVGLIVNNQLIAGVSVGGLVSWLAVRRVNNEAEKKTD